MKNFHLENNNAEGPPIKRIKGSESSKESVFDNSSHNRKCQALRIVLQHWMVRSQKLGWKISQFENRQQEIVQEIIAKKQVRLFDNFSDEQWEEKKAVMATSIPKKFANDPYLTDPMNDVDVLINLIVQNSFGDMLQPVKVSVNIT